jgi:Uma2 family endonuclease
MRSALNESSPYRFSKAEFEEMLRAGWFSHQSAEFVDGAVFVRNGPGHAEPRKWTRDEYLQMSDWSWFDLTRVQLIGGEVIEMAPQLNAHAAAVSLTVDAVSAAFGPGYWVRTGATLDLSPRGMPDPDIAVVQGSPRTAQPRGIPTTALLVIEVSQSTLRDDRTSKASLYAAASIADYWIVNLVQRQLEVHRNPVQDGGKQFGWRYDDRTIVQPGSMVSPLAVAAARISVDDLLP